MSEELLSASGEAAWQSLRQHIEWTPGFWIGWVFTDHTPSVHELHSRIARQLRVVGRSSEIEQPREPGELAAVLAGLLAGADGCDGCVTVAVVRQERAWQDAWDQFLLRLNERRELLRQQLRGGLLLCVPTIFKARSREAAPDLWSIRSLALDVGPVANAGRGLMISLREDVRDETPGNPEMVTLALQAVTAAQRAGQAEAETTARIRAAEALFAVGRRDEGREQAVYAVQVAPTAPLRARALVVLAGLEHMLGDLVAAERHYRAAIDADAVTSGARAYRILGQLLLLRGALEEARAAAEQALAKCRDPLIYSEGLPEEALSVLGVGEVLQAQGDLSGAVEAFKDGLELSRRIRKKMRDTVETSQNVVASLHRLGDALRQQENWSGAGAAYEEALVLVRRIRSMKGDTADVLRGEMLSLIRVGVVMRAQGDWSGAEAMYQEALMRSRRIIDTTGESAETLRDCAFSLNLVGDVQRARGDWNGAKITYLETLQLSRRVRRIVGDTAGALRELAVNLNRLGDVLAAQSDWSGAGEVYDESLVLARRIRGMVGDTIRSVEDLILGLQRRAAVYQHHGDSAQAREMIREAMELLRGLEARGSAAPNLMASLTKMLELLG